MLLYALLACRSESSDGPPTGETGEETGAETGSETGEDTASAGATYHWVVGALTVAERGEGFDLDGDGRIDNALWVTAAALDPLLASLLAAPERVILLQAGGVDAWNEDADLTIGVLSGGDTDEDSGDNLSGSEVFDPGAGLDDGGLALLRASTSLSGGAYTVEIATDTFEVGALSLDLATGLHLAGSPVEATHVGLLGFGVETALLVAALEAAGVDPETAAALDALADLDLDGDGVDEAVSVALAFDAVSCGVAPTQ